MTINIQDHFKELRVLIADVLEIAPEDLTDTGSFADDYDASSLDAVEMMAQAEKKFDIVIDQAELPNMVNLRATYAVIAKIAGWQD
ncbi:phosphopantetheine-binding protein [Actinoallomurus sp. NPDC052274]|uniref:acyl carrier protein n=1 Tax=Actinoallomurus sp. NPDC052274 TaxID=3155420 RepID=UPI0034145E35